MTLAFTEVRSADSQVVLIDAEEGGTGILIGDRNLPVAYILAEQPAQVVAEKPLRGLSATRRTDVARFAISRGICGESGRPQRWVEGTGRQFI